MTSYVKTGGQAGTIPHPFQALALESGFGPTRPPNLGKKLDCIIKMR